MMSIANGNSIASSYDIVVIGSGPAGQKAAVQGAKAGKTVLLVEADRALGGACVHRGTIPSKTLRESALRISQVKNHASLFQQEITQDKAMASLIANVDRVLSGHDSYISEQIARNTIDRITARASFIDAFNLSLMQAGGNSSQVTFSSVVIAVGSYPRELENVPLDHEHIYDSDSILSMNYLPESLTVLGGGVIASEYASIFASLGVKVWMIDRYPRPLGFLDSELTDRFVHAFENEGGEFFGNAVVSRVHWDDISKVVTELDDGRTIRSDKLLCAAGRLANTRWLALENVGLSLNDKGLISVDDNCRTSISHIYAVGDVIGPPSLASASMEQGRLAARAIVNLNTSEVSRDIPMGIYAIPELSSIGMTADVANKNLGGCIVGIAKFEEVARGQISAIQDGLLKIVADKSGDKILGVQIVGEGATELIHIGQMAMLADQSVDIFVDTIFNFPTLAEAYRVAALNIIGQR